MAQAARRFYHRQPPATRHFARDISRRQQPETKRLEGAHLEMRHIASHRRARIAALFHFYFSTMQHQHACSSQPAASSLSRLGRMRPFVHADDARFLIF